MRRYRKNNIQYIFIMLLLGIGIGFAYLNTSLAINGTVDVSSSNWDIYWNNLVPGSNNVTNITTPAAISQGKTEVTFAVSFTQPGDTYEFTVDAVNNGSINAMIDTFSNGVYAANGTTPKNLPDYLEYTVTYSDGVAIANHQLLSANSTETYKVRVHFKEDITASQLPSTADSFMFKFSVTYVQADSSAVIPPHPAFNESTSWEDVITGIQNGTITPTVGDTKTVDLGSTLGTHTLRVANTTTPAECSTTGFSQTACGLVIEFADIITTHRMNPYDSSSTAIGNGNIGGWPASEMRTYVNSDIYNALPTALKNAICDTTVVSGHGSTAGETNFTSTDKLYLLSPHEVWEDVDGNTSSGIDYYDTAYNNTRQLDYYAGLNVTTSSHSGAIKKIGNSNSWWWLRSASSYYASYFTIVDIIGTNSINIASNTRGVSPAFRIG